MNYRTVDRLYILLVLTHILFCYVACFSHQSAKLLLNNSLFLLTFDSLSDLIGQLLKMMLSLYTCASGVLLAISSQVFTNIAIAISGVMFVLSTILRIDYLYYISWLFNRLANGTMNYIRDMIMYKFSLCFNINIPFIKALKAFGTLVTLFHIYYLDLFGIPGMVLFCTSSLLCTICGLLVCFYLKKLSDDEFSNTAGMIDNGSVNGIGSGTSNNSNLGFSIKSRWPVLDGDFFLCSLLIFIVGFARVSDQIIFSQGISHKSAVLLKSFGQIVLGVIYAKLFHNKFYGIVLIPAVLLVSYICFTIKCFYVLAAGVSMFGLLITMTNSTVLVAARSLTGSNYLYPTILFSIDSLSSLLSSLVYDAVRLRFDFDTVMRGYIILSLCCFIASIFIYYLRSINAKRDKINKG